MDLLLEIVLEKIIKWEMHYTWTNYYTSYSIKLAFFSFFNSALVPIECELTLGKSEGFAVLISNMFMKFIVNSFVMPLMWSINFKFLYKKCMQDLIKRKDKIYKRIK